MVRLRAWYCGLDEWIVAAAKWLGAAAIICAAAATLGDARWVPSAQAAQSHEAIERSIAATEEHLRDEDRKRLDALRAELEARDHAIGKRLDDQAAMLGRIYDVLLKTSAAPRRQ